MRDELHPKVKATLDETANDFISPIE
jgi:hypothetical protein